MTKEQMTVHKALAELKLIEARVNSKVSNASFIRAIKASSEKIDGIPVAEFTDMVLENFQSITDLIARRDAIKRAVVLSNATTKVTVCGKEYTVAEAIDMKNNSIELRRVLENRMNSQYREAVFQVEQNSGKALEERAERYIQGVISAQPKDSKMSVSNEGIVALRDQYIKNNEFVLIDPIGVAKYLQDSEDSNAGFLTEIDSALSVSNALTIITIEY